MCNLICLRKNITLRVILINYMNLYKYVKFLPLFLCDYF